MAYIYGKPRAENVTNKIILKKKQGMDEFIVEFVFLSFQIRNMHLNLNSNRLEV